MNKENKILLEETYNFFKIKRKRSVRIYVYLNLSLFTLSAIGIVLNIFALRLNNDILSKDFFIVVTILTASSSALSTIISTFKFKIKYQKWNKQIKDIKEEVKLYENNENDYSDEAEKDSILLGRILEIRGHTKRIENKEGINTI
ncbi:MAG: DUF4231 domain-containing protein [Mycoplasma sp.]|nr:DUF4231 domain-containing protein [Mycoplasma sp.]